VAGSMRQRSSGSWELRDYAGGDPETRRSRYRTKTVRGTQAEAERELAALVATVRADGAGGPGSSVSVLLERWFTVASRSWAPTTIRQTRSVLDRYLHPHIGSILVGSLTAAQRDELYADLGRSGSVEGGPLSAGTVATIEEPVGDGYVFSDDNGATSWKPNRVTKAFLRCRRAVGLRSFRLHDLRHFMATQMLEAGVPIVTVSRRLAHRRVSTLLDHYAHPHPAATPTHQPSSEPPSKPQPMRPPPPRQPL